MNKGKCRIGYTQGTFDMFHIGHLNLLKQAKERCEILIVGVNSDELVKEYKNKVPVIGQAERAEILRSIKYVDEVILCNTLDKLAIYEKVHFDAIFIGDDWKGNPRWTRTEEEMRSVGAEVIYLSHTQGISSTMLRTREVGKIDD